MPLSELDPTMKPFKFSSSNPFLSIAKHFHADYSAVLLLAQIFRVPFHDRCRDANKQFLSDFVEQFGVGRFPVLRNHVLLALTLYDRISFDYMSNSLIVPDLGGRLFIGCYVTTPWQTFTMTDGEMHHCGIRQGWIEGFIVVNNHPVIEVRGQRGSYFVPVDRMYDMIAVVNPPERPTDEE